ncbi:MAG: hypothetical protein NVS3B29_06400 [Candidatus Saccharimonadales bacterium]
MQITADYNAHAKNAFIADASAATPKTAASTVTPIASPAPAGPAADPVAAAQARLTTAHLKPDYAALYLAVQARTGTPWQLLAAVHQVETGGSGDTTRTSYAGAVGPMQFMPTTFAHYALDGDGNGTKSITSVDDAVMSAGNYLRAGGASEGRYSAALYNYNHSSAYVNNVLTIARRLGL